MEATGRDDGGLRPSWSYRRRHEETGTISSSSRSGTIVSTAYTSSGSTSRHSSSSISMESELRVGTPCIIEDDKSVQPIKKPRKETGETLKEKRMKHIESLVQEFSMLSGGGGGMSALERWFSELGVSWVLQLDVTASTLVLGHPTPTVGETCSWIRALTQIMETIRLTESFFPDHGHGGSVGMPGISDEEVELPLPPESGKQATTSLDPVQFALFFQQTISKMLVFVDDAMFSKSLSIRGPPYILDSVVSCLHIHSALSKALSGMRLQFHSSTPTAAEVERIEKEMVNLLSAKQGKAFEAIWSALEEIRTRVLKSMEDSLLATQTPQGSSDIHEATCSVMNHIKFLLYDFWPLDPFVSQAASLGKYVPQTGHGDAPPFNGLVTELVSCLEEKLIIKSQLFLDKGLRFLFLLNNSNFIWDTLKYSYIKVDAAAVTRKVEHYIESYMVVSWAPVLACVSNPMPLCLGRIHSPLSKFESEFQKTYTTQKLWKVPDPRLRKRLRKAVIKKKIPDYTRYIEDSKVTNPKFTPKEPEEMLQELFEG